MEKDMHSKQNFKISKFEHNNYNGISLYIMTLDVDECFFETIIISHILSLLGIRRSQKKVILWIFDHIDNDCRLIDTIRGIAQKVGVSTDTARKAIKAMQDNSILIKERNGVYSIDRSFILRDFKEKTLPFLIRYDKKNFNAQKPDIIPEQKILSHDEEKLPKKSKEKPPWVVDEIDPDEDYY